MHLDVMRAKLLCQQRLNRTPMVEGHQQLGVEERPSSRCASEEWRMRNFELLRKFTNTPYSSIAGLGQHQQCTWGNGASTCRCRLAPQTCFWFLETWTRQPSLVSSSQRSIFWRDVCLPRLSTMVRDRSVPIVSLLRALFVHRLLGRTCKNQN